MITAEPMTTDTSRIHAMNDINEEIHERLTDMNGLINNVRKIVPVLWILVAGAFALGGWVTVLQSKISTHDQITVENARAITEFALWKERTESSRFTTQDGMKLMELVNLQDKRLTRTEDTTEQIKKSLDRIESKLVP